MREPLDALPKKVRISSIISTIGGICVLLMGLLHFPMAYGLPNEPSFAGLGPAATDLLILLCMCVGILLIFVGGLSLYFARRLRAGNSTARGFFLGMGGLFLARTILELMYPVAVPQPDVRVLVSVLVTSVIFFTAALVGRAPARVA